MLLQDKPMPEQLQPFPPKPVLWQVMRKPPLSRPNLCVCPWGRRKNRLSTSQDDAKNNTVPLRDQGNKGCEGTQSLLLPIQTSVSATAN